MLPTLNVYQLTFLQRAHSYDTNHSTVATSHTLIASVRPAIARGVALEGIGWWVVQLFYYVNFGKYLLLPLGHRKCDTGCTPITPRATPAITGSHREEKIYQ
jgi:hypothetical protein